MAVNALELRPRSAVALFDAALRVCATSAGVWALTLPAGAVLLAALFELVETIRQRGPLLVPVALFTGAWALRALSQGAACHFLDMQVLGNVEPSLRQSALAALKRAPALVIATTVTAVINAAIWGLSLGFGFLFLGAHAVAYAATLRGQGSVLGLYGTCSKLLGPTRHFTPWVRLCGLSQVLLALQLHVTTAAGLSLLRSLFGFDVTFLERFAAADNPTWIACVAAVTFALFEPVRAATAALLLIDGRVRQEGLDLIAQIDQLPRRQKPRGVALAISLVVALLAPRAAADEGSGLAQRAAGIVDECGLEHRVDLSPLTARQIPNDEQSSLSRLLSRVEHRVFEEDDCDAAEADLREGLRLYAETLEAPAAGPDPRDTARAILARPEFQVAPPKTDGDAAQEPEDESPGWFAQLLRRLLKWLSEREPDDDKPDPIDFRASNTGMAGASAVMIGAVVLVAVVLLVILVRSLKRDRPSQVALDESGGLSEQPLAHDAMSALARPPETWASLADELAARGEYREAIRHLYLALLSRLHRDGAIDYDPTRSNWEYLLAFKGTSAAKAPFRELTRRFDFAWYGNLGVDALAYALFRQTAAPLLQPPEGAPASA